LQHYRKEDDDVRMQSFAIRLYSRRSAHAEEISFRYDSSGLCR